VIKKIKRLQNSNNINNKWRHKQLTSFRSTINLNFHNRSCQKYKDLINRILTNYFYNILFVCVRASVHVLVCFNNNNDGSTDFIAAQIFFI